MYKRLAVLPILGLALAFWLQRAPNSIAPSISTTPASTLGSSATDAGDSILNAAIAKHARGVEVEGEGTVEKVLHDDDEGIRHQKFILRLASGDSVLIAHNIDLSQRIDGLRAGDRIAFRGEYEWTPKGGVIHWTHRDPAGRHAEGWLRREH